MSLVKFQNKSKTKITEYTEDQKTAYIVGIEPEATSSGQDDDGENSSKTVMFHFCFLFVLVVFKYLQSSKVPILTYRYPVNALFYIWDN